MIQKNLAYKLLIFDWDGTLMDSSARIVNCMHHAADFVGVARADELQIRAAIGLSLEVAVARLFPALNPQQTGDMVLEFRRQSLGEQLDAAQLFPGARETLQNLSAQGYHLAVATGKSRHGLDKDLAVLELEYLFPISRTAEETFSKPHPLMLEEILTDYDLSAEQALMIGDTEYDLQMAAEAGMDALAVSYGVHELPRLLQHQPHGVIDHITHLPEWLNKRKK